jgi:F0F1-type ATP synthase membrane subunit b/b'
MYLFYGKTKKAINSTTQNIITKVENSQENREKADEELKEAKKDYDHTPEEAKRINEIAQNTLQSLKLQAKEDTEKQKENIAKNAEKIISEETAKIISRLSKETAENSVKKAERDIEEKLSQNEELHDKLIEKAIQELEIF